MPDRREFLGLAGASLAALALGAADETSTWLTYAINVELFWKKLPLMDRLKQVAEAGFNRYEFGLWRAKDLDAIVKANEDLNLQITQFLAYAGFANPKRKGQFLDAVEDAVMVAQRLGTTRFTVVIGDAAPSLERDEQVDGVVDALKEAAEKVAEAEMTILVESTNGLVERSKPLLATIDDLAGVVKAVDSKLVKVLFDLHQYAEGGGKDAAADIAKHKDLIGYYQLADHPGHHEPKTGKLDFPRILKAIQATGHAEPIGLELAPKADPLDAIKAIREADAAAKKL